MKVLVLGLGSMGKRRIRCLKALGVQDIIGFDIRSDRCQEATELYQIKTLETLTELNFINIDAVIISLPPDIHAEYMNKCLKHKINFFVEAGIIDDGFNTMNQIATHENVVAYPSATLLFHPAIQKIIELVKIEKIGQLTHFFYHSGQYLPDWHPYENVADYYVSNPPTGGAREIVPFELTWLSRCFGWPKKVFARVEKTITIPGAEKIHDTYFLSLNFGSYSGSLLVDVTSRVATRKLMINGSLGQINWNWDNDFIEVYETNTAKFIKYNYDLAPAYTGYNKNITEQMYIDEINNFINCCKNKETNKLNNLIDDAHVLHILTSAEKSAQLASEVPL